MHTNIAYVSNYDDKDVSVIDGKTNHIEATIKMPSVNIVSRESS